MVKRDRESRFLRRVAGWCAIVAGLSAAVPGALGSEIDHGEEAFNDVCSDCHSVELIFEGRRMTSQQWDNTIVDMVGRGAEATDEKLDLIGTYLKETWGAVLINRDDAAALTLVLGLTPEDAESVIQYREENGDFEDIESLQAVPGIDPTVFDVETGVILFL